MGVNIKYRIYMSTYATQINVVFQGHEWVFLVYRVSLMSGMILDSVLKATHTSFLNGKTNARQLPTKLQLDHKKINRPELIFCIKA